MKNFFKILVIALTSLLVGGAWWATESGWSLPLLAKGNKATPVDCPTWQRDSYGNCPPQTHRLRMGLREYEDNNGK
jgi:hypothetical protein